MKAIVYIRVSTDEQTGGNSLDRQRELCTAYANQRGWTVERVVQDDYSGAEYERPGMDTIRQLADRSAFNALIVMNITRFARDEAVALLLERYLTKRGVQLFSVEEGEFTPGKLNPYLAAIQRVRAEDDRLSFIKRVFAARSGYIEAGYPMGMGQMVYGYRKVGKRKESRLEIVEAEAEAVRTIYRLYTELGLSRWTIANQLNAEQRFFPSKGQSWSYTTITRILKNSAYAGKLVQRARNSEGQLVTVVADIPAIIDDATWRKAQYRNGLSRQYDESRTTHDYMLTGLVTCYCGYAMGGSYVWTGPRKPPRRKLHYYRCAGVARSGDLEKRHRVLSYPVEELDQRVWAFVSGLILDPDATLALYQHQTSGNYQKEEAKRNLAAIAELLGEYNQQRNRTLLLFQKGHIDEDRLEAELASVDRSIAGLVEQQTRWQRSLAAQEATEQQYDELHRLRDRIESRVNDADPALKRLLLERLGVRIQIDAEKRCHLTMFSYDDQPLEVRASDENQIAASLVLYASAPLPTILTFILPYRPTNVQ